MDAFPIVVKVGGSLFDLPDLATRLDRWLASLPSKEVILIPGGGATVDVVRDLDRTHHLAEEVAHWLAIRAMGLNAYFLAALVPHSQVVDTINDCWNVWQRHGVPILDVHRFAFSDQSVTDGLPHSWNVTSDSAAVIVARFAGAARLILLKSVTIPGAVGWDEAVRRGWVDPYFATAIADCKFTVQTFNLRAWKSASDLEDSSTP